MLKGLSKAFFVYSSLAVTVAACGPAPSASRSLASQSTDSTEQAPPLPPPRSSSASNMKVCAGVSTPLPGLDVSNYDPGTQWTNVQHSGHGFTFVKATEGLTYTNPIFSSDWTASRSAGLLHGAYHFFHPSDDPVKQAQFYLQTVGQLGLDDLPPMLDWEVTDGVSAKTQIQNALVWLQLVEAATGKTPVIYVDPSFWNELGNPSQFERYPLFIAHYDTNCPSIPPPWSTWTFWQTGTGPITGLTSGDGDLDVFNGSFADLVHFAETGWY